MGQPNEIRPVPDHLLEDAANHHAAQDAYQRRLSELTRRQDLVTRNWISTAIVAPFLLGFLVWFYCFSAFPEWSRALAAGLAAFLAWKKGPKFYRYAYSKEID